MLETAPQSLSLARPLFCQQSSSMSMGDTELNAAKNMMDPRGKGFTAEDLASKCFPPSFDLSQHFQNLCLEAPLQVSEDPEDPMPLDEEHATSTPHPILHTPISLEELKEVSHKANLTVSKECEARQGNLNQRWAIDPTHGYLMRLVTGCVPILNDGRIVLISSSKQNSWLCPKGGWESDELLEEAAIRESYEESGLLGALGPKIASFFLETKKARRRRLQTTLEDKTTKPETVLGGPNSGWSVLSQLSEEDILPDEDRSKATSSPISQAFDVGAPSPSANRTDVRVTFQLAKPHLPHDAEEPLTTACDLNSLLPVSGEAARSTASAVDTTASIASTHTHVCMTFFPLYVQSIQDTWPEDYRLRQAFHIDEALKIVRPEFRPLLEQVKANRLHIIPPSASTTQ
eukprot:Nitzschia sp. Nitz4//scaffold170_size48074//28483//29761//NITZ4_007107-RA/size48074-augustus-gene-0.33-mRNA-1//-1//CDS//3329538646//1620//frame0